MLQGLAWATFGAQAQNRPQNVGTFPGHDLQLIARNHVFETFRGELPPPPFKGPFSAFVRGFGLHVVNLMAFSLLTGQMAQFLYVTYRIMLVSLKL